MIRLGLLLLTLLLTLLLHLSNAAPEDETARQAFKNSVADLTQKMYISLASQGNQENFVFSPLSLHQALSILYLGATDNSDTDEELNTLLGGLASKPLLQENYERLSKFYQKQPSIKVGNSVWVKESFQLKKDFIKSVNKTLRATTENVDFTDGATMNHINQWVHDKTNGLIPTIIDSLDPQTALFIANALYFKDKWLYPFQEMHLNGQPLDDIYFNLEGNETEQIKVPMMLSKSEDIGFGTIGNEIFETLAEVIHIPYISGKFRMKIIVPDNRTEKPLETLEKFMEMNKDKIDGNVFSMKFKNEWPENVRVIMPKFKISSQMELSDWLKAAGVKQIFEGAELSNMLEEDAGLAVSKILQKSVITVDKEGTEGASATGVGLVLLSGSFGRRVEIDLDRPFIFVVEDRKDNIPILVGRVKNPGKMN